MSTRNRFASLVISSIVIAAGLAPVAVAQDAPKAPAKPEPTLKVGSPAPEFKVEKFLKGTPFTGFEKGKVYVVEFWSTWCGPCIASMPHLSELQHQYADKGVTICGVNIWEDQEYTEATLTKASDFVTKKGDGMAYTVAYDGAAKHMDTNWMKAAGRNGIPSAFLVDQKGVVAWMGHPMQLDIVLEEVVAGKWDIVEGPARIKAAGKAFQDAAKAYETGLAEGDKAWAEALAAYPAVGKGMTSDKFDALLGGKHYKEAYALGDEIIATGIKNKNNTDINGILGALIAGPSKPENVDKAFVMKAAQASYDLSDKGEVGTHIMFAQACYAVGENEKAQAACDKALEVIEPEQREGLANYLKQMQEKAQK